MCELAVDQTSNWLMVDPWEAIHAEYMPTALVLEHFEYEGQLLSPTELQILHPATKS